MKTITTILAAVLIASFAISCETEAEREAQREAVRQEYRNQSNTTTRAGSSQLSGEWVSEYSSVAIDRIEAMTNAVNGVDIMLDFSIEAGSHSEIERAVRIGFEHNCSLARWNCGNINYSRAAKESYDCALGSNSAACHFRALRIRR